MYRVIIEHHPKKGQEEALIRQWQKGSDVIQTYPGARGTKLFRDPKKPEILYAMELVIQFFLMIMLKYKRKLTTKTLMGF